MTFDGDVESGEQQLTLGAINPVKKEEVNAKHFDISFLYNSSQASSDNTELPVTSRRVVGADAIVIDNVLTLAECRALCRCTDASNPSKWNAHEEEKEGGEAMARTDYRNADTVEVTQHAIAERVWTRVKGHVTAEYNIEKDSEVFEQGLDGVWDACGINENLLFAKYGEGGHFAPHTDGMAVVDFNLRSLCSAVIYLNDCGGGGQTRVIAGDQASALISTPGPLGGVLYTCKPDRVIESVEAKAGRMLVFWHDCLHEGVPVERGAEKYIIRTDVMYSRREPRLMGAKDKEAFALFERARDLEADGKVVEATRLYQRCVKLSAALAQEYGL